MGISTRTRGRPFRVAASVFLALFVFGVTAPSFAASGDAKGSENSSAPDHSNVGGQGKGQGASAPVIAPEQSSSGDESTPSTGGSSGDANADGGPQPISNADENDGGANGQCPGATFCSTKDGSESKNGNGDGKAVGKPCAGCVGKADNKNPPGQSKHDHNKGYECDRNKGIGKTNPAHTGCKAKPHEEKPEEEKPEEEKPEEEKPEEEKPVPPVTPPSEAPTEAPRAPAFVAQPEAAPAQGVLPQAGMGTLESTMGLSGLAMLLGGLALLRRRVTS
jgi:LPXTG-motif cell wall-anchored protein